MRKVIVTEFLTLDGVMEEPTPWQQGYSSPEIGRFKVVFDVPRELILDTLQELG